MGKIRVKGKLVYDTLGDWPGYSKVKTGDYLCILDHVAQFEVKVLAKGTDGLSVFCSDAYSNYDTASVIGRTHLFRPETQVLRVYKKHLTKKQFRSEMYHGQRARLIARERRERPAV